MKKIVFLIILTLLVIVVLMCASSKQTTKVLFLKKELVKETRYFIKGIDDTCDTSIYKCIDMRSLEYNDRMKSK